jgi:hypothetical protein
MSFTNPQKKKSRGVNVKNKRAGEWVPVFLFSDYKTLCPEMHKHGRRSSHRDKMQRNILHHSQKCHQSL